MYSESSSSKLSPALNADEEKLIRQRSEFDRVACGCKIILNVAIFVFGFVEVVIGAIILSDKPFLIARNQAIYEKISRYLIVDLRLIAVLSLTFGVISILETCIDVYIQCIDPLCQLLKLLNRVLRSINAAIELPFAAVLLGLSTKRSGESSDVVGLTAISAVTFAMCIVIQCGKISLAVA